MTDDKVILLDSYRARGTSPERYPPDYLVTRVYPPLGMQTNALPLTNPMTVTMEQALCAMTFWGAYAGGAEREVGALASPHTATNGPGWLADFVVWTHNPLAIHGAGGLKLEDLATMGGDPDSPLKIQAVNAFIQKFRPALTVVGGMPMYRAPGSDARWQGNVLWP